MNKTQKEPRKSFFADKQSDRNFCNAVNKLNKQAELEKLRKEKQLQRILKVLREADYNSANYNCGNCIDGERIERKIWRILK